MMASHPTNLRFDDLPNVECIADMIPFKMSWPLLFVEILREIKTYPVVEMEFHPEANQVEYVICPARIDDSSRKEELRLTISEKFNHVGLLPNGFQTGDDEI
jgi:5-(carboxyamino)imidazole ribonucleotide synthase